MVKRRANGALDNPAGAVRIDIGASRRLTDLAAVHREAESGQGRGKIVLIP